MRVAVFFVYLFFHLLGGRDTLHAGTHHNSIQQALSSNLAQKENPTVTDTNHISIIIEDADLDLDEECCTGNTIKAGGSHKFADGKHSLSDKWYLAGSCPYISNYSGSYPKIFPLFCGYSSPIYIQQRTLRI